MRTKFDKEGQFFLTILLVQFEELTVDLQRHWKSILNQLLTKEKDSFDLRDYEYVPSTSTEEAIQAIARENKEIFDSTFLNILLKFNADHPLVELAAPLVQKISVKNLKQFSEIDENFQKKGKKYFDLQLKGIIVKIFLSAFT